MDTPMMTDEQYFSGAAEVAQGSQCKKRKVGALLVKQNTILGRGFNKAYPDSTECPRPHLESGQGYELCYRECGMVSHAEVSAIQDALRNYYEDELSGSTMYLSGHDHACEACQKTAERYGISIRIEGEKGCQLNLSL